MFSIHGIHKAASTIGISVLSLARSAKERQHKKSLRPHPFPPWPCRPMRRRVTTSRWLGNHLLDGQTRKGSSSELCPQRKARRARLTRENPPEMDERFVGMERREGFPRTRNPIPCGAEQPQHLLPAPSSSVETQNIAVFTKASPKPGEDGWVRKRCHEEFAKLVERSSEETLVLPLPAFSSSFLLCPQLETFWSRLKGTRSFHAVPTWDQASKVGSKPLVAETVSSSTHNLCIIPKVPSSSSQ